MGCEEAAAEVVDGRGVRGFEQDGAEGEEKAGAVVRVEEGGDGPSKQVWWGVGGRGLRR